MNYKVRPVLVLASIPFGSGFDYFLCAVSLTAEPNEPDLIGLDRKTDMEPGATYRGKADSGKGFIRPTTLFTIDGQQVNRSLGRLTSAKMEEVLAPIRALVA